MIGTMFPAPLFNTLFIIFLFLFSPFCSANYPKAQAPSITDFTPNDVASWHRLIHLPLKSAASRFSFSALATPRILSAGFYLSGPDPRQNFAEQELQATVALFRDSTNKTESICRFPARFLWLSQRYTFDPALTLQHCSQFIEWSGFNSLDTISLIFVSGYMGNPASTFGHVLLKLNSEDGQYDNGFFDLAINFGARVPAGESSPVYIAKGLLGGYTAGFTNEDYYRRDLVYANSEQRDTIEYKLKLNDLQKQLLVAHLWELNNHDFQYYFLRQNCAYRIAELLELVLENDNINRGEITYAPATLFHNLEDYAPATIQEVKKNPSPRRSIFKRFKKLSKKQQQVFNELVSLDGKAQAAYKTLAVNEQKNAQFLDLLLDYNTYQLASIDDEKKPLVLASRKTIVSERLRLPPGEPLAEADQGNFHSPIKGSRPTRVSLSHVSNKHAENKTTVEFSPFYYDALGQHGQDGSEIIMMNTELSYNHETHTVRLGHVDFLKIQQINTTTPAIAQENRFSWRLWLRGDNNKGCRACLDLDFSAGLGKAVQLNERVLVYGFIDGLYDGQLNEFALSPVLTAIYSNRQFGIKIDVSSRQLLASGGKEDQLDIELRYRVRQNLEAGVVFGQGEHDKATIKLNHYF